MNQNTFYVGLDLGSTICYQVIMNERGKIVRSRPFATNEQNLRSAFSGFDGELRVHPEAGELADWVSQLLKPLVKKVVVSHPQSLAWIAVWEWRIVRVMENSLLIRDSIETVAGH